MSAPEKLEKLGLDGFLLADLQRDQGETGMVVLLPKKLKMYPETPRGYLVYRIAENLFGTA